MRPRGTRGKLTLPAAAPAKPAPPLSVSLRRAYGSCAGSKSGSSAEPGLGARSRQTCVISASASRPPVLRVEGPDDGMVRPRIGSVRVVHAAIRVPAAVDVLAVVNRGHALQQALHGVRERVVGGVHAGEERVASDRRHLVHVKDRAQRRLEVARALLRDPVLLLLDEPAGGMTPRETEAMTALVADAAVGRTLVLVEHKMEMIVDVCSRVAVLNFGRLIAEGTPDTVLDDPAVVEAYLGPDDAYADRR